MWINCQCRAAAATAPLSGTAFPTICVSFMTLVSVMALVATPLLSPLVIGYGTLTIGMLTTHLLLFDYPYSPLPHFGSEVEALPSHRIVLVFYCLSQVATYLSGPIVG
jgi:hypothetical protein